MHLDIVIPTLNESGYIGKTIENIFARAADVNNISVWISDCASSDNTLVEARNYPVNIPNYQQPPYSRASAMNYAADLASGDALMFVHADAMVPVHFDKLIFETLAKPGTVGGAFKVALDEVGFVYRLIERLNALRYHLVPRYFGDQAIFVNRSAFMRAGRFPDIHIMEDSQFCKNLLKIGRMRLVNEKVFVSARRIKEGNPWRLILFDIWCSIRDALDISNEKYSASYKEYNRRRGLKTDRGK